MTPELPLTSVLHASMEEMSARTKLFLSQRFFQEYLLHPSSSRSMFRLQLFDILKTPSHMDVAPWCYKWIGLDGSPGGVRYRAPYGANYGANKYLRITLASYCRTRTVVEI